MEYLPDIERLISSLAALGAVVMGFINRKSIKEVHVSLNSRLDQMLKDRGDASEAIGVEKERDRVKNLPDGREGNGLLDKLKQ